MTNSISPSEFALKRIEEDRDVAEACLAVAAGPWTSGTHYLNAVESTKYDAVFVDDLPVLLGDEKCSAAIVEYIAMNDPAKTIRTMDFLEQVVEKELDNAGYVIPGDVDWFHADGSDTVRVHYRGTYLEDTVYTVNEFMEAHGTPVAPSSTLLAVCALWASHEDYNSEWAVA